MRASGNGRYTIDMNKQDAINLLGGSPKKAAQAMGYVSVHAIYMWPDVLSVAVSDRVLGAVARKKTKRKAEKAVTSSNGRAAE